jgi:hypothetical protein
VSLGLTWAVGVILLGWAAAFGWGTKVVDLLASVYRGYAPGFAGGLVGGAWAFVDAFVAGLIVAALYNALSRGHAERMHVAPQPEVSAHA